jgi:hypothetical protein
MHLTTVLEFLFTFILFMILDCALGCRSWIGTLVAFELLSSLSLLNPIARDRSFAMARCRYRLR